MQLVIMAMVVDRSSASKYTADKTKFVHSKLAKDKLVIVFKSGTRDQLKYRGLWLYGGFHQRKRQATVNMTPVVAKAN
jgi:hypothetical protein